MTNREAKKMKESDYYQVFKNADVTGEVCVTDNITIGCLSEVEELPRAYYEVAGDGKRKCGEVKACCGGATCEGSCCEGKVGHPPSAREQLLKDAIGIVTKDRNNVYGPPEDSFTVIGAYWDTYLKHSKVATVDAADVAIMMALMKMGRLTFNKRHRDSAVDAAGYLACLQEAIQ
jgi:hypothetical protein